METSQIWFKEAALPPTAHSDSPGSTSSLRCSDEAEVGSETELIHTQTPGS